jgi:outer membrane lipoprotein-sorting protein
MERSGGPMRRTRMATIMITFIALAVTGFEALPGQESGKRLLERVERTYNSLDSYQFQGTISSQVSSDAGVINIDSPFVMAAIKPDKVRVEIKSPAMGLEYMSIASGTITWEYLPRQGQYTRKESKEAYVDKELSFRMWALALGVMLPSFERITAQLKRAEIVREESIEVSGSKNCYVVEAEYDSPDYGLGGGSSHKTFWIDRDR